jgi:hypothetical protein
MLTQFTQVKESINTTEEMILGNVVFQVERVEQSFLTARLTSHHR